MGLSGTHLVVGATPYGVTLAARLRLLGEETMLVGRRLKPAIELLRFEGWNQLITLNIKPLTAVDVSHVKIAFFTVRPYDLEGCFDRYLPYLPKGIPIVAVCRGAIEGTIERGRKKFPSFAWRIGCCQFQTVHHGLGIHELKSNQNRFFWGPLNPHDQDHQNVEQDLAAKDQQGFFSLYQPMRPMVRKTWLFDVVINTICAFHEYAKIEDLFKDTRELHDVFQEAYKLGKELWGAWEQTPEQLFSDLVNTISVNGQLEAPMNLDLKRGARTLNDYFAYIAHGHRGFDRLCQLSEEIKNKSKFSARTRSP